ncbi:Quinol monooxygenase YgiN [Robiginitalea myxolifaciens]|uniref:Quinol monooxygenase YgiN n=1 Tax=Robiginitalea myxolifaciens TaxID=400055 RepID=A0A1I6H1J3_9FLAO|nr:antibiotic biosynthesis monooxygenase family protein [Robiginitalea myxolifaciens]SFR48294.1 Quinol monooxygenase YgiN [Robiginitalea myxolifaciens]
MLTRIVCLQFKQENIPSFERIFESSRERIRTFPGCKHLELLRESGEVGIFFTYSKWESESALENYRKSPFFKGVWSQTKALFAAPAKAWSLYNHLDE